MASADSPLLSTQDGGVLTLTMNRPEKLNSLNTALLRELAHALQEAAGDDSVRCLVLTGAGRAFCSGADITEPGLSTDLRTVLEERYHPVIHALRELDKPVVASINGVAAGAGLSLALACDLRVAAATATLIQAFVRIGLVPDAGGTYFLARLVGPARSAELAMLGDAVPAGEAERIGLVNRVVPDAELAGAVAVLAARLAAGPRAVGLIKRLLDGVLERSLDDQMALEGEMQAAAGQSEDFAEGVSAFVQRRPAKFRGR